MSKKMISTFDREMKNNRFKTAFEKKYREFLLSELLTAMMEEKSKSVRKLAKEVGLSPTIIQNIRSGKQCDIKMSNFVSIADVFGYNVILERENDRIQIRQILTQHVRSAKRKANKNFQIIK